MIAEIQTELWERFFIEACAPFKRKDVLRIIEIHCTPFDNDLMHFVGVFQLKDKTFGTIYAEYSGTLDEVLEANCYIGKRLGNLTEHVLPHKK